jgi:tetratricopeptide (TPR) repeat protein
MWLLPLLALAAFLAYQPAWHGGILWEDEHYVTEPVLSASNGLWRIWFDIGSTEQYYPVVFSVLWLLHLVFGEVTTGYHLVNIALHAGSAFLFAAILRRLKVPGATLAALIFALHPVHVESVAWIAESKNTISGILFVGAALAYLRFDETRQRGSYVAAAALFVLALFAKANTAVLPAALLVVFWWQRGRLDVRRDVVPLAPFFVAGLAVGLGVAWVEHAVIGADTLDFSLSPVDRVLVAGRAVWFYLATCVWPVGLMFTYPRWQVDATAWWQYLYPLGLGGLALALWMIRDRARAPFAALAFFCVTVAPAAGAVSLYYFRYSFVADHFQYLSTFGVIALAASALTRLFDNWRAPALRVLPYVAVILPLGLLTWHQSRQYANAETLYRTTLARDPSIWMAHNNLGVELDAQGRSTEAVASFREAARLQPRYAQSYVNLGGALLHIGQIDDAVTAYREAVRLEPKDARGHAGLGHALAKSGQAEAAVIELQESIRLNGAVESVRNNLGVVLDELGRTDEAIGEYTAALAINPDWAEARNNLGAALATKGRIDEAAAQFAEAVRINPGYAEAQRNLGLAFTQQKRPADAIRAYKEALRLAPGLTDVRYNLAVLLANSGNKVEAIQQVQTLLQIDPDNRAAGKLLDSLLPY